MQITQSSRAAHSAVADRPGWGPTPRSRRRYSGTRAPVRDGAALRVLRCTAYALCSLASALFIALVVYGGVQLAQQPGGLSGWTQRASSADSDYAAMRESIAANGGRPSSLAEERYLQACTTGALAPADCP